jgi:hypothetical protein
MKLFNQLKPRRFVTLGKRKNTSIASLAIMRLHAALFPTFLPLGAVCFYTTSTGTSSTPVYGSSILGPSQLASIEQEAHGTLPNAALPSSISQDSLTSLQLIAFNEIFEVAFFTELLFNLTNNVDGYELSYENNGEFIIGSILTIQNACIFITYNMIGG